MLTLARVHRHGRERKVDRRLSRKSAASATYPPVIAACQPQGRTRKWHDMRHYRHSVLVGIYAFVPAIDFQAFSAVIRTLRLSLFNFGRIAAAASATRSWRGR